MLKAGMIRKLAAADTWSPRVARLASRGRVREEMNREARRNADAFGAARRVWKKGRWKSSAAS